MYDDRYRGCCLFSVVHVARFHVLVYSAFVCDIMTCCSEHPVQGGQLAASCLREYRNLHDGHRLNRARALCPAHTRSRRGDARHSFDRYTRHHHRSCVRLGVVRRPGYSHCRQLQYRRDWPRGRRQPIVGGLPCDVGEFPDVRLLALSARRVLPRADGSPLRQLRPPGCLSMEAKSGSQSRQCRKSEHNIRWW